MRWTLVLLGLVGCGDRNKGESTPPGTVLIRWDGAKVGGFFVEKATTIGTRTSVETILAVPLAGRDVKLRVDVETTSLTHRLQHSLDGKVDETTYAAPIKVTATVVDDGDVTLLPGSCNELGNAKDVSKGRATLLTRCGFRADRTTRSSGHYTGLDFIVCGDGRAVIDGCK